MVGLHKNFSMTINSVGQMALPLTVILPLCLLSRVALSAPILSAASQRLELHPTITDTLSWRTSTSIQLAQEFDIAMASSRGRKRETSRRSLIASNTTSITEVNALLAFRNAIQTDPTGALANWTLEKNNSSHYCSTWMGVECSAAGEVIWIDLPYLGLNGTITPKIGDLVHLIYLNLSGNNLWGPIPAEFGKCQNLSALDLNYNSLDGEVPSELFIILNLEFLWLSYNRLSGALPEVNACPSLRDLRIRDTDVSGAIPSSWSRCQNLEVLNLRNNQLNGSIPATLGGLHRLRNLFLDLNALSGSIPSNLSQCQNLTQLTLTYNQLIGGIPTTLGELQKLEYLRLGNNVLEGNIPSQLGSLKKLWYLQLNANKLTGTIPASLGLLSNLQELYLHDNKLTGSIPAFLGNCSSLTDLYLGSFEPGHNNLTGTIPEEYGNLVNLVVLYLMYNEHLTGPVPGFLSKCSSLERLYFRGCRFTSIAPEIWSMKSLQMILLTENILTGELPPQVGNCTNLVWLDLQSNNLSGTIPAEFGNLNQLQLLLLNDNKLTGTIPSELGRCLSSSAIVLSRNNLTGDIPKSFSNLSLLENLDLTENNLTSSVADMISILSQCTKLKTLMVGKNNVYGSLQVDFAKWPSLTYFSVSDNKLSGSIPPSFGSINSSLIYVDFSHNGFTGEFPVQVDSIHFSALRLLRLSYNELEGAIPEWLGNLKSLQLLDLSHNKLNGSIPQSFSNLDGLKELPIGNAISSEAIFTFSNQINVIYGAGRNFTWEYGDALTNATTYLDLSSNALQGEIPHGIADLVGLTYLRLSNNKLEGEIWPPIFQNLTALETLDLSQNDLTGPIPSMLSSVSTFNVSHNDLSGPIPTGSQFDTFTNISSYLPGNPGLCGAIIHRPCVGDQGFEILDYLSIPGLGIGAAVGFFIVVVTSCTWAPAHIFVFGAINKRKATAQRRSAYGLYNPSFEHI